MFRVASNKFCPSQGYIKIQSLQIKRSKYDFLKDLEIENDNPGLFDGQWGGTGKVSNVNVPNIIFGMNTIFKDPNKFSYSHKYIIMSRL